MLLLFAYFLIALPLAASLVPYDHDNTTYEPSENATATEKQIRWSNAAFSYVESLNCEEAFLTTTEECRRLKDIDKADMNIYIADPSPYYQLASVLPDGGLSKAGLHDAAVVIDPYPKAEFGHLVLVFYVEIGVDGTWCRTEGGIYLGGECMIHALKRRCKNAIHRRQRRRNFIKRCEINFIPTVFMEQDKSRSQVLSCRSNIPGFAPCPETRTLNETTELICNPIRDNTKRCQTSHDVVSTSCRIFEKCDQAVLLSGGWNRWTMRKNDNMKNMYDMLRRHGFRRRNIEVFYANGAHGIPSLNSDNQTDDESVAGRVHPAAFKMAMRHHLQRLCSSPHCVDSLLFYVNNPAKSDGSSLLWDADGNGEASADEIYTLDEMLTDLAHCAARQVHVVADQSYSGEIARAFRRSDAHANVMVFASSKDHEYAYNSEFTQHWTGTNHTTVCMKDVHKESKKVMNNSTPDSAIGQSTADLTLFGAPCDVVPPFSHRELRHNYLGCQNLPTALWVMTFARPSPPHNPIIERLMSESSSET